MSTQPQWGRPVRGRAAHALLAAAGTSLVTACGFEPKAGPIHYSLNPKTLETLAEADLYDSVEGTAAQIEGALELLVGTPSAPQFLVLDNDRWTDAEFDPNYQGGDLEEGALEEIAADNARRFARQLELVRADRFAEVPEPKYAEDLWIAWGEQLDELVADPAAEAELGDGTMATRKDAAADLFVHWYPTLRESAEMYRQQCLHCHGPEGGGNGPTSDFLEPRPRDYRMGIFKWVSVAFEARPVRSDLLHLIENGVFGTAMPPFARYSRGELEGLVDYVRLLAVRGETETFLAVSAAEEGRLLPQTVVESYEIVWDRWLEAASKYTAYAGEVPREMTPESIEHGRVLFNTQPAECYTCHGAEGRGDGVSAYETEKDAEGKLVKKKDKWGNDSEPRNFYQAILRGGSRPIDMYRRIRNGISGTIMPAASTTLTDENVWDLVHYVQHLVESHDVARLHEAKLAHAGSEPHADEGAAHEPPAESQADGH